MPTQRPLLVIDTNMVFTDRALQSPRWKALAVAVISNEVEVVVPEVVVRETARHMQIDAKSARTEIKDALHRIKENLEASGLSTSWPALSKLPTVQDVRRSEELGEEHARKRFRDRLDELGFGVAPIPSPSHDHLVDWSLRSHPPFDQTDKGYRDALIWWTFIELATADPQRCVIFVSNDNDCFVKNAAEAKPELAEQLSKLGLIAVRFARRVDDALTTAQRARAEASPPTLPASRLRDLLSGPVHEQLLDDLIGSALGVTVGPGAAAFLVDDMDIPTHVQAERVSDVDIPEPLFASIRDGYKGSTVSGSGNTRVLTLACEGLLEKAVYNTLRDDEFEQLKVLDADWNDHMMQVEFYRSVVAEFSFSIDSLSEEVLAVAVGRLRAATELDEPASRHAGLGG